MLTSKQPQPESTSQSPAPVLRPDGSVERRRTGWLGSGIQVEGKISSDEDLQIDGVVEGPISVPEKKLTVGSTAQLNSEIVAREIVVYGEVQGNLRVSDRIEIKKDGSVIGDITTRRIVIEDGAHIRGTIEIDRSEPTNRQTP